MRAPVSWPEGKSFAFTVFDDTDASNVENTRPVYDFLAECGFRTTKSVWPLEPTDPPDVVGGATCAEEPYLRWVMELQKQGFEIGYHNATSHSSARGRTLAGLDRFRELFGHDPRTMANHTTCREAIYWGPHRLSGAHRSIYNVLTRYRHRNRFRGHIPGDDYFWGDLCSQRVGYVRNFVFADINVLESCPFVPYHDPERPFVRAWYASSEGTDVDAFNETLSDANQDRLEAEGGACIMYAHFAKGFFRRGKLDARFTEQLRRLSRKNGWFVPTSTLLDFLGATRGVSVLSARDRRTLERRWLRHKVRVGTT